MIRTLIMIAVAGFVLSLGAIAAAVAIGGPDVVARGGWHMFSGKWGDWRGDRDIDWEHDRGGLGDGGPQVTRTLDWSGADSLDIDLPADVRYVQQAGPGRVEITGPERAVERVVVRGDSIRYEHRRRRAPPKLTIVVTAPDISDFDVSGVNTLSIEGYRQARLSLDVSGDAEVVAVGQADDVRLDLSGASEADLGGLKTLGAEAEISGASRAVLAPSEWARLEVSGASDVSLVTNPPKLESEVTGAGRIRRGESPPVPAAPAPAPTGKREAL
ncbi:MAG: DUF2807 domain-containing protein [Phenylobacterium sp.]|nr:DUF2807 domain-containing protein [Phenylobacterium sp.]